MNETLGYYDEILIKDDVYIQDPQNVYNYIVMNCGYQFDFLKQVDQMRQMPDNIYYYSREWERMLPGDKDTVYGYVDTGIRSLPNEYHPKGEPILISCLKNPDNAFRGKIIGTIAYLSKTAAKRAGVSNEIFRKRREKFRKLVDKYYVEEPEFTSERSSAQTGNPRVYPNIIRPKALQKKAETALVETKPNTLTTKEELPAPKEEKAPYKKLYLLNAGQELDKSILNNITEEDTVLFLCDTEEQLLPVYVTSILFSKNIQPQFIMANSQEKLFKLAYFIGTTIREYDIYYYGEQDNPITSLLQIIFDMEEHKERNHQLFIKKEEPTKEPVTKKEQKPEPKSEKEQNIEKEEVKQEPVPVESSPKKSEQSATKESKTNARARIKEALANSMQSDPHGKYSKIIFDLMQNAKNESEFNLKFIQTIGPATGIPLASSMKEIYKEFRKEGA